MSSGTFYLPLTAIPACTEVLKIYYYMSGHEFCHVNLNQHETTGWTNNKFISYPAGQVKALMCFLV